MKIMEWKDRQIACITSKKALDSGLKMALSPDDAQLIVSLASFLVAGTSCSPLLLSSSFSFNVSVLQEFSFIKSSRFPLWFPFWVSCPFQSFDTSRCLGCLILIPWHTHLLSPALCFLIQNFLLRFLLSHNLLRCWGGHHRRCHLSCGHC